MKKLYTLLLFVLAYFPAISQQIKLSVKFSEPLAVFFFVKNLSDNAPPGPFKTIFKASEFNVDIYKKKLSAVDSISLDYSYEFKDYPAGQKIGEATDDLLKANLVNCSNLDDFRVRSLGLIPMSDLNKLVTVLHDFTPVYEKLIYEPNKAIFEKQLKDISELLEVKNIPASFEQAKVFYNSSWDNSVPFVFSFYPLPTSNGFTATAINNIGISAIPTSLTDYNGLLSVLIHEMCHIICDEQPLAFKLQMDQWFASNPSKYSRYAEGLVQESWATAVGNGYFGEKLRGSLNPGNWYGRKYINLMAKQIYPMVKQYMDNHKPFDKAFVDEYIKAFEDNFSDWITDLDYLLTGRTVISENKKDYDVLKKKFPYDPEDVFSTDFSDAAIKKLKGTHGTKLIIISTDNKNKLSLVKSNFSELKNWQPDSKKDFTYYQFLQDRSQLVIINLVENDLKKQLDLSTTKK